MRAACRMVKHILVICIFFLCLGCSADPGMSAMRRENTPAATQQAALAVTATATVLAALPTATLPARPSPAPVATASETATLLPTAMQPERPSSSPGVIAAPPPTWPVALYQFPIGWPGQVPGDGFFIRHSVVSENTWYNPGYWHTGEDWYASDGDTAGAAVYAVTAGEVVYVGANYPGRVVIVHHDDILYSMYGHLDPAVGVAPGQRVERGTVLGSILQRNDDVPDHLHFEIRTFFTTPAVNGPNPRYNFRCGPDCPPGPGYWPIGDAELPGDIGWYNPTHTIAGRMFGPDSGMPLSEVIVASRPISDALAIWSAPPPANQQILGELALQPGDRYVLSGIHAGTETAHATSAEAYQLWYQLELPDGRSGWVQAGIATTFETGSDGQPATIQFTFWPVVDPMSVGVAPE